MKKNILIIGAGRFGRYAAIRLHSLGHQVMIVDKDEERIGKILLYTSDARIGDSTDKAFLHSLGIGNYDLCLVTIGDDFLSSLQTTFTLQELGAKEVIARANSSRQEKFLLRNGADAVVFPERELGYWTAIRYSSDSISNYFELSGGYAIYEIKVPERWAGKKIGDLNVRRKYHINILGLREKAPTEGTSPMAASPFGHPIEGTGPTQGKLNMDVRFDTVLQRSQSMLVLGKSENIQKIL